ncbi:MAG: hypothetical protein ACC652_14135, partial [Acidimicrobiales bacterium]
MRRTLLLVVLLVWTVTVEAGDLGFMEQFALAPDRSIPLKQLIPGTEDYYYFHCLHYQSLEQYDKVREVLQAWVKRYKTTPRVKEILHRQALLTYSQDPARTLEHLKRELGLRFNHQQDSRRRVTSYPTALNANLISRDRLLAEAFRRRSTLERIEDRALDWLVSRELTADRRRNLLQRLSRPDHDALVKLILDDLKYKNSGGFGSIAIHKNLLLRQLDECVEQRPDLLNQTAFVQTYVNRLRPRNGLDWKNTPSEYKAYLERLQAFVNRLSPVHNSLKAHVQYHRLAFDRSQGVHDAGRFLTYLKLPRNMSYVNPKYLARPEVQRFRADTNAEFSALTLLPRVGNDEPLVRSYLHHFFEKADNYENYEPYLRDTYLKRHFAETKIVNGLGDGEKWYSMLAPAEYQALKERVDLDFEHTNRMVFAADDPVDLDLFVKNVKTLIVKVYEINTQTYYRARVVSEFEST